MTADRSEPKGRSASSGVRPHIPVLLSQVLTALSPKAGEAYLDATFGAGGYSAAILLAAECRLIGLDRDPTAIVGALPLLQQFGSRLRVVETRFSQMEDVWHRYEP